MIDSEPKQTKIAILIDGNNFYRGLERSKILKASNLSEFDYDRFVSLIAQGRKISVKKFYKGVVKKEIGNTKSLRMVSEQQRIFASLENAGWQIGRGRMSKNHEFGKCGGFYFLEEDIEKNLEEISHRILEEHQLSYSPIIIVNKNANNVEFLKKAVDNIKDEGSGLKRLRGLYFVVNRWREKGVDVNIAIDMLDIAYSFKEGSRDVDTIMLVSSDSDLKPVVERVQELGVSVEYVGFEYKYSIALLNTARKRLLLTESQLQTFLPQTPS